MRPLVVVVTGSESTGKTTLARSLARAHDAAFSPEFARDYLERKGAPLITSDVEPIARGQRAGEDVAAAGSTGLVVRDTDLVSTAIYARHYYGTCPAWIEEEARARLGDLYLLCHPDVPWVADGLQRDRALKRQEMHALFAERLLGLGARVVDVEGSWRERWEEGERAVSALLRERAAPQ